MASPVVLNDPRRRPSLPITAPGGFGPAFPQVGDVFEIRIRYWNYCNPYSNNPANPMVPVSGNLINGDNPPVETVARVRIVAAPPAPTGGDLTVCNGTTPSPFQVNGVPAGNIVNFYRDVAGAPGALIGTPSTSTTLPITSHPNWAGTANTARVYRVWASYRQNVVGSCESPPILITRTIREAATVPNPTTPPPAEICNLDNSSNPNSFTIVMPAPVNEPIGGVTSYTWNVSLPSGITLGTNNATQATYNVNVSFAPGELFQDKTITINRHFNTNPSCSRTRNFTVRVYNTAVGGTPSAVPDVCETTPVGTITLSGHRGELVEWQQSLNGGPFVTYTGPASGNSITPGLLTDGTYRFRAMLRSSATFTTGPCGPVFSTIETVVVSDNPDPAAAGPDQDFCGAFPANSTSLLGSNPGSGTGVWTFVSSFPTGLPTPTFTTNANDRNTAINVTAPGAYVMRWTVSNGTCTSFDEITVDFGGDPTDPIAGPDKSVCGLTTNLAGNTPLIGFGNWTLVSAPGGGAAAVVNPTSPNATINLLAPFTYGTYTFRWTITSGSCPPETDDVQVTFFEVPVATASDIANVCIGPGPTFTAIPLSGTISGAVLDGTWVNVSGNGTVSATTFDGVNYIASYTPTQDDYNAGVPITVKFIANPSAASPCTPDEQEIVINIDRTPVVNAGSDIPNICGDAVQLNAENPPPFGATGQWTTSDGVSFDNPVLPNTTVRGLPLGSVQVTWTLTSASGLCSSNSTITLTRVPPPAPVAFAPLECEVIPPGGPVTTSIVLSSYEDGFGAGVPAAANREITWYRNAPPPIGTVVASPSIPENNINNGQVFIARIKDLTTNCVADGQLTINVRPLPPAVDAIVSVCETDPVNDPGNARNLDLATSAFINPVTGGASNVDISWYPTFLDAQNETNEITTNIDVLASRVVHARVVYNDALPSCPDFAEIEIRVNSIPSVNSIGGDPTVCMGGNGADITTLPISTYQVPSIPGAKYYWTVPQGAGEFAVFGGGGENDFFVLLKFPFTASPAPLDISVTIDFNGCSTPSIPLTITRSVLPGAPTILGDVVVCEDSQTIEFEVATPDPGSNYTWEIRRESDNELGGAFIASGQATPLIRVNFLDENVVINVKEENGECVGPVEFKPVRVHRLPIMTNQLWTACSDQASGILLSQDPSSPVAIDYFNIPSTPNSVVIDPRLTYTMTPPAAGNGPANMLQLMEYKNQAEVPLQVIYKVAPVSEETFSGVTTVCAGPEQNVVLTVNPEPVLESGLGKNVCSDETTEITLRTTIASYPADKYVITSIDQTTNPGVPLTQVGLGAPINTDLNADAIFNDAWHNPGAPAQSGQDPFVVTYFIAAKNSITGCVGFPSIPVPIRVFPKPDLPATVDVERCSGDNLDVQLTAANVAGSNTQFTWTIANIDAVISGATPQITPVSGNQATIDNVLTNSSPTVTGQVSYNVQADFTNSKTCTTNTLVTVDVKPAPSINPLPILEVCSDAPNNGLVATVDLIALEPSITAGTNNIAWYETDPSVVGATAIATPNAFAVQDNISFYAEVSDPGSGCIKIVSLAYDVHPAVQLALTKTDVTCFGANDGRIEAAAVVGTGTGPFNYTINAGPPVAASASYTFQGLGAGNYTVAIEDANKCTDQSAGNIIVEPLNLVASMPTAEDVSCFFDTTGKDRDGKITITATGGPSETNTGTGSYIFTLMPGNIQQTNGSFANLKRGFYTIRVEDASNTFCETEVNSIEVGFPDPVEIISVNVPNDGNGNNVSCFGATNGEIEVIAQGGTGSFNFTLDPVHPSNPISEVANVPATFSNLGAGTYKIFVEDQMGCKAPQNSAVITQPTAISPGIVGSDQDLCEGANAAVLTEIVPAFGGTGNYEYQWENSSDGIAWFPIAATNSPVLDPNATVNRGIPITYYRRVMRDISPLPNTPAACLIFQSTAGNDVEIRNRPKPAVVAVGPNVICEGVQSFVHIELLPALGTAPLTFNVNYREGQELLLNRSSGSISESFEVKDPNLMPRIIRFESIKDAFGCAGDNVEYTYTFQEKPAFTVPTPAQCADQNFEFTHVPDPNLQYQWTFGDGTDLSYFGDNPPTMPIPHQFPAGSTSVNTQFTVTLTSFGACANHADTKQITVFPSIARNILQPMSDICAGSTVTYEDNSLGVTSASWQYQYIDEGGNIVLGPIINTTGEDVSFTLDNPTNTIDPLQYTITYTGRNNQNCVTSETLGPINVYHMPVASFDFTPDSPQMVGGLVNVTYDIANHNPAFFEYEWPGDTEDIDSESRTGNQRVVTYTSDEDRTVTLKVTNTIYAACTDSETLIVPINRGTPIAGFAATPLAGCFPINVTTENFSVNANTFEWTLTGTNGTNERSAMREPQFRISSPGVYVLSMIAFDDGVPVGPPIVKTINVFDVPVADFMLRQTQVYIGQEVEPINLSRFATEYLWDFGDGETSIDFQPRHHYTLEGKDSISLVALYDHGQYDIDEDGDLDGPIVCADTIKHPIHVIAGGALKIPNAFTPNVSGPNSGHEDQNFTNDVFLPIMEGVEEFTMLIFDRWGTLVFESKDKTIGWNGYDRNGRLMPAGVYVFKLVMRLGDGQRTTKVGDVTLIR
jgi:gliding motility-associated-like protein